MNTWVRKRKARGFTLVELLIVIVIIGILAGSMLLVFGSATDKAKATKIVSDMRSLKAAALMYYADTNYWPRDEGTFTPSSGGIDDLAPYMDRANVNTNTDASYDVAGEGGTLYIRAEVADPDIQDKLEATASETGLVVSGDNYYRMVLTN